MINPYNALTTNECNWVPFLEKLGLFDVFGELTASYYDTEATTQIIKFIVWTYSANSTQLTEGMEWEANKRNNYRLAGLPQGLWEPVGLLKDPTILRATHRWLDWQEEPVFKQLQCLRDLKLEMQLSCVGKVVKSSGEIDFDQKFKNAQYALDLDAMIQQLENQSILNDPKLKDAIQETNYSKKTMFKGPEAYAH